MKKKVIIFIIMISSVSLIGIVFTQLYWVRKSLDLKGEQFDNSVRIAMKSVINQLLEIKNDPVFQKHLYDLSCRKIKLDITDYIVPATLDSLLFEELNSMELAENYFYGIYRKNDNKFVTGRFENKEEQLITSPYQLSLSSVYRPGEYYLTLYFPTKASIVLRQMEVWLMMSVLFLIVVIFSFVYVILTIFRQKKLAELKTDFINNMTHEFKTPLATTSLAAEMLLRPQVAENSEKVKKYARVIVDENQRLKTRVEQVLEISSLENGKQDHQLKQTDLHEVIKTVIRRFEIQLKEKHVKLILEPEATNPVIVANEEDIANMIFNLIDNAIKYTPDNPEILIRTWNSKNGIFLRIRDNGIGIKPEHHRNIFKNLFRVPTGDIHEVRGYGIGLYYVKKVVEQHHGTIEVESELGKGSVFDVYLPFGTNKK